MFSRTQPSSFAGNQRLASRKRGFTLIETIASCALAGLAATMIVTLASITDTGNLGGAAIAALKHQRDSTFRQLLDSKGQQAVRWIRFDGFLSDPVDPSKPSTGASHSIGAADLARISTSSEFMAAWAAADGVSPTPNNTISITSGILALGPDQTILAIFQSQAKETSDGLLHTTWLCTNEGGSALSLHLNLTYLAPGASLSSPDQNLASWTETGSYIDSIFSTPLSSGVLQKRDGSASEFVSSPYNPTLRLKARQDSVLWR